MAYNNFTNCTEEEYLDIIYSQDDKNRIRIWFNNVELEDAGEYCESLTGTNRVLPNDGSKRFTLSNFIAKEYTLILRDLPEGTELNDQVKISIGTLVDEDNDTYEDVPIGIFNIQDTPTTDKDKITIKLRDNRVKFDFDYNAKPLIDENDGSATLLQILNDICTQAGVENDVITFEGQDISVGIYDNTIKATSYVAYIAEQAGAIPVITREGHLDFVYLNNLKHWQIPLSIVEKYEIGTPFEIERVVYESGIIKYETSNDDTKETLYLDAANMYVNSQEQVDSVSDIVKNFKTDSVITGKVLGNPAIDPYDIIEIYDEDIADSPITTGEGTDITLENTIEDKLELDLNPSELIQKPSLPSEYTQVEYIQNSGTQYIDTGFKPNLTNGFKIEVDYTPNHATARGCLLSNYAANNHVSYEIANGNQRIYIYNGSVDKVISGASNNQINKGSVQYYNGVVTNSLNGSIQTTEASFTGESAEPLYMFVDRSLRFSTFVNYVKIYKCRIYDGNTLVRDYIPCYRNSDNEIGMYDLVNNQFYTNAGTGTFLKGNDSTLPTPSFPQDIHTTRKQNAIYLKDSILPAEYTEVEYIKSTGSQWLDTLLYPTDITKIEADITFDEVSSSGGSYFIGGYYSNVSSGTSWYSPLLLNSSNYIGTGYGYGWAYTTKKWELGERHKVTSQLIKNSQYLILDGETIYTNTNSSERPTVETTVPLMIYQYQTSRLTNYGWKGKIYSLKIYGNNNELIRNYVPCIRDVDNVAGLYDLVNNVFYTNAGTGTFVVGDTVEQKQIYDIDLSSKNLFDGELEIGKIDLTTGENSTSNVKTRSKNYIKVQPNTNYKIAKNGSNVGINFFYYDKDKNFISYQTISSVNYLTTPSNCYYLRWFTYNDDTDLTEKYQINKGTSILPYEPYYDYGEYCKIGNYEDKFIRTSGKNKLTAPSTNGSVSNVGITLTYNTSNEYKLTGTATGNGNVLPSYSLVDEYTIQANDYLHLCNNIAPTGTIQIVGRDNNSQIFATTINSTNKIIDLSSYVGRTLKHFFFYVLSGANTNNIVITPMILNGISTATDYEPYGTGWYLKKNIGKVVLDGSENWSKVNNCFQLVGIVYPSDVALRTDGNFALSDHFTYGYYASAISTSMQNGEFGWSGSKVLTMRNDNCADASAFQTWLGSNNTIIEYPKETPTYTPITGILAEQLEAIHQAKSKKGLTNITQKNSDLPFQITATAYNNSLIFKTLANNNYTFNGVHRQNFETQIGLEERKENVTLNGDASFRKSVKTEINNVEGTLTTVVNQTEDIRAVVIGNYSLTEDTTFQANKTYYYLTTSGDYEIYTDYSVGDTIPENTIYEVTGSIVEKIDENSASLQEQINSNNNAIQTLSQSTTSQFAQTVSSFEASFNTVTQAINNNQDSTNQKFDDIRNYLRYEEINGVGVVTLGTSGSEIVLKQRNDRVYFEQNGNEVAYISNNQLYITDAQFLNSIRIGNFAFIPRDNGSLGFRKVS